LNIEPNKGPKVNVIPDIAAPIERKAMKDAKILPQQSWVIVPGLRPLPEGT